MGSLQRALNGSGIIGFAILFAFVGGLCMAFSEEVEEDVYQLGQRHHYAWRSGRGLTGGWVPQARHNDGTVMSYTHPSEEPKISPALNVLIRMNAKMIGGKTIILFKPETKNKLNEFADSILSKVVWGEKRSLFHIANPDVHRMACFFVTHYVYAMESERLPAETQVYLVNEENISRLSEVMVEINNLQGVFSRCKALELSLYPNDIVYFGWDDANYLNSVTIEMIRSEKAATLRVPDMFKDDPLLFNLYQAAAIHEVRAEKKDRFIRQLGDETVNLMLAGVKTEFREDLDKVDLGKVAQTILKKTGKKIAQRVGQKIWKQRRTLVASLTRDDSDLFIIKQQQENMAEEFTNLVAFPGRESLSKRSFVNSLKGILGRDAKLKLKIGRKKVYAGFSLQFK